MEMGITDDASSLALLDMVSLVNVNVYADVTAITHFVGEGTAAAEQEAFPSSFLKC